MMDIPDSWFVEPIRLATYQGDGAYGPVLAEPITVYGNVDSRAVLVRNAQGNEVTAQGNEVTAQQVLRLPPVTRTADGATVDPLVVFTPDSEVTIYGRPSLVLTVKPFTVRGVIGYVEVTTT